MLLVIGGWAVFSSGWLNPLERATGRLVSQTLVANLVLLAVVLLIICGLGKLRLVDVGLRWSQLGAGATVTATTWLLMQLAGLTSALLTGTVALAPTCAQFGVLAVLGALLAQLCGNALVEEVSWRGFALPQPYGQLARRAWWRAMPAAQPAGKRDDRPGPAARPAPSWLDGGGLRSAVFAAGNLFVAVGLHALLNTPTLLFAGSDIPPMVMLLLVAVALLVWPQWRRENASAANGGMSAQLSGTVAAESASADSPSREPV
jgi:membrane protease YdiL (CAAX protease family)